MALVEQSKKTFLAKANEKNRQSVRENLQYAKFTRSR